MSGVRAMGPNRIQFTIWYRGKRYRPTVLRASTEANLRRARRQMTEIQQRIQDGTFCFAEEFPDYRGIDALPVEDSQKAAEQPVKRTCSQVFDAFLRHCQVRVAGKDLAFSSYNSYRKILARSWRPKLDNRDFESVVYSELVEIASSQGWKTKKTYNNGISTLRRAFEFGYKDLPGKASPAKGLESFRLTKKDRPKIDPFSIQEAEKLIRGIHHEWGEAIGNFDEFRFFTGLRQSEEMGLRKAQCDLVKDTIEISETVVLGQHKDRTKTNEDRTVELCPRALAVLKRQFALREQYVRAGKIKHDFVFFRDDGQPMRTLKYAYMRWRYTIEKLKVRYREPYNARHSCVSWNLMMGKNLMWVARQHGHSVQVMLSMYGAWIEGSTEADIEAIKRSMQAAAMGAEIYGAGPPAAPINPHGGATKVPLDRGWGRLSWRKTKHFNKINGGADGTRTRDPRRDRPVF
jgi:integrase